MFLTVPALVKILSVFALVLILNRFRVTLSLSLLIGAVALGLWLGLSPRALMKSILSSIFRLQTVGLLLIVGSILVISRLMTDSGHLDRIVRGFTRLTRDDRTVGSMMPALIGLLPMPGGALFSAPMVETALNRSPVTGEGRTAVNYWFRHVWEYWWPLYPGVVLAVVLLDVETWRFMAAMFPMSLVTTVAGIFFILRPLGRALVPKNEGMTWRGVKSILWEIMPILVVVMTISLLACAAVVLRSIGINVHLPGAVSILPGLAVSVIWVCVVNHIPLVQIRAAVMDKKTLPMLFLVATIMVFQGIMTDSDAVIQIRNELLAYHIPVMAILMIIPFLSGIITGIAIGFVGTSFPLIVPLFKTPDMLHYLSCAVLAYTFGFMGQMLSPVHLCFLVSKDYFKASLIRSYGYILAPSLTVMAVAVVLFVAVRGLL